MPLAATPSFSNFLIPALAGRFISGDEEHGDTPATRLSGNAESFAVMPHARREKTGVGSKNVSAIGEASGIRRDTDGDYQKKACEKQN